MLWVMLLVMLLVMFLVMFLVMLLVMFLVMLFHKKDLEAKKVAFNWHLLIKKLNCVCKKECKIYVKFFQKLNFTKTLVQNSSLFLGVWSVFGACG